MLRRATEDDAQRIAQLQIASWQRTYRQELPAAFLDTQDVETRTADWQRQLRRGATVLLAEDGAELAGFVACGPALEEESGHGTWQIYTLHVSPDRQRQGVGGMLFRRAAEVGLDQGAAELVLWVAVSNSAARSFYERKGMTCDGSQQERLMGAHHRLPIVRYRMRLQGARP